MRFRLVDRPAADTHALGALVYAGHLGGSVPTDFLAACGFTGELGQTAVLPPDREGGPARIVAGLGSAEQLDIAAIRVATAAFARAGRRFPHLALTMPAVLAGPGGPGPGVAVAVRAIVEAASLALYEFTPYRSQAAAARPTRLDLVGVDDGAGGAGGPAQAALELGVRLAGAVAVARDLVNEPGGTLTPTAFAARAVALATVSGMECVVWDAERIARERLGGLLGVSRGSAEPPVLVRLAYVPDQPAATIALVGKGVTFDSGGLTMKPASMMAGMKSDMAGAAAVLAAMSALRDLRCPVRVIAFLALTDNMVSGDATRVGDVLRIRNGTTVEVLNTDAEGRLILADALVLAGEEKPDGIVDIATLTDAAPIALGRGMAAMLGRHDDWLRQVQDAADRAGEPIWPLPLRRECRPLLESKIADLVNHKPGERFAGAIVGALFLAEFVPTGVPWAHLDIGGCALADRDEGEWVTGGTGYGVRTLVELLTQTT